MEEKTNRNKSVRKTLITIAVIVAVVLGMVLGFSSLWLGMDSANVKSGFGLRLRLLSQPDTWCSQGTVKIKVSSAYQIKNLYLNGEEVSLAHGNVLTVDTNAEAFYVQAVTSKSVLEGTITFDKIDSTEPSLRVERTGSTISMTALDNKSGVEGIYYAVVDSKDDQIPSYQRYEQAIPYESGKIYYCYAQDNAGNQSKVEPKTLETLEGLSVAENVRLTKGDYYSLDVKPFPEGAWVNQLRYESQNTEVATVDQNGLVTAVAPGSAVIKVYAEGVAAVNCVIGVMASE